MRLDNKVLFGENTSPYVKSIILKRRAGIPLTEQEQKRFKCEVQKLHETVSMVEPTKYHDRISPTGRIAQTFGKQKSIEDMEDDDEIDLDEILREMGYEGEEDEEDEFLDTVEEIMIDSGFYDEEEDEITEEFVGEGVRYSISYKTPFGNYRHILKNFSNEKHFSNWYSYMSKKGYKIIGVEDGN